MDIVWTCLCDGDQIIRRHSSGTITNLRPWKQNTLIFCGQSAQSRQHLEERRDLISELAAYWLPLIQSETKSCSEASLRALVDRYPTTQSSVFFWQWLQKIMMQTSPQPERLAVYRLLLYYQTLYDHLLGDLPGDHQISERVGRDWRSLASTSGHEAKEPDLQAVGECFFRCTRDIPENSQLSVSQDLSCLSLAEIVGYSRILTQPASIYMQQWVHHLRLSHSRPRHRWLWPTVVEGCITSRVDGKTSSQRMQQPGKWQEFDELTCRTTISNQVWLPVIGNLPLLVTETKAMANVRRCQCDDIVIVQTTRTINVGDRLLVFASDFGTPVELDPTITNKIRQLTKASGLMEPVSYYPFDNKVADEDYTAGSLLVLSFVQRRAATSKAANLAVIRIRGMRCYVATKDIQQGEPFCYHPSSDFPPLFIRDA
jgi:hypothetical protein